VLLYLSDFIEFFSFLNIFKYITVRTSFSFLFSFLFVLILQPVFIKKYNKISSKGQPIRDDGPKTHEAKVGVPTMGGLVIIASVFISSILFADPLNLYVQLVLFVLISLAILGMIDDLKKVIKQNSDGVSAKIKFIWQIITAIIPLIILYLNDFNTNLNFPIFKNVSLSLGIIFILFGLIVIVGTSNAVNLTDGLDGLAIGPIMTVSVCFGFICYFSGNAIFSDYLNIDYIAGSGELCIILSSIVGSGLGFLWYNTFPASVFMGDLGALSLGGALAMISIIVKNEILLAVAGGIFVIEALSVIIQRYTYKLTKKRFFKMAPIHHHFELKGWAEPKIIVRFWIISIVLALIALVTLKVR